MVTEWGEGIRREDGLAGFHSRERRHGTAAFGPSYTTLTQCALPESKPERPPVESRVLVPRMREAPVA